jgi:hypothetical protein
MQFIGARTGSNGKSYFEFSHDGQRYLVTRSADGRRVTFETSFSRWTNNVFGNGSQEVYQSGYRRLPYGGPAYCRLRVAYEDLIKSQSHQLGPSAA